MLKSVQSMVIVCSVVLFTWIILSAAFSPKTLVIPSGTDYASGILYLPLMEGMLLML